MAILSSGADNAQPPPSSNEAQRTKLLTLMGAARSHLSLPYVEATCRFLQNHSGLLEHLAHPLLAATDQDNWNGPAVQKWLADTFERNGLWIRFSEEIWVNVLAWTVQDLDTSIAVSTIQSLGQDPFRQEVWDALFHPDLLEVQSLLKDLIARFVLELTERLQGIIGLEDTTASKVSIEAISISPTREVQPAKQDSLWVGAWSTTVGQSESPIRLAHVLTRSEELILLPWELMTQLQQQGGLPLVQLAVLLTAHGIRQSIPEQDSFSLKAHDVLEQLDWPTSSVSLMTLLHGFERVCSMEVTSVWMLDDQRAQAEAFQVNGRPWEILTDLRGNLDWKTGRIGRPDLILFTIRPGLWVSQVLKIGSTESAKSFEGFARWALSLLKLDLCRDPFLLGLLIYLMRAALSESEGSQFACFSVQELLEAVLQAPARQVLGSSERALILFNNWNQALNSLSVLGWASKFSVQEAKKIPPSGTEFYIHPCPEWLNPISSVPKPPDWIEVWLAQSITLKAPQSSSEHPTRARLSLTQPLASDRSLRKLRFDRLTGSEIRTARKAMRLTQAQLAQSLHVHQSLVAKIEAGRRSITEDLEQSLRQILQI